MTNKFDKTNWYLAAGLFTLAFFVSLTSFLNPFGLNRIEDDTSVYLTIARGITEGNVPYRDFFDNKGPLVYLISALGLRFGGFTGVWIIQLGFLCVSVFFAYKISLFFAARFSAFLAVVFSFLIFRMFYIETAGPGDYSMPFVLISLYILVKYYFSHAEPSKFALVIFGFCFASAVLMGINMASLWFVFCPVIIIEKIVKRNYFSLLRYATFFIAGFLIVFIPIMLYLHVNNAISDFIGQYIFSGSARAFSGFSIKDTSNSFFAIIQKNYSFIPLVAGAFWILTNFKSGRIFFYSGFFLAYILVVLFHAVIGRPGDHYNMPLLPFIVPALAFFVQSISPFFSSLKYRKAALVVFLSIVFSNEIITALWRTAVITTDRSRIEMLEIGRLIDRNTVEGETIISLGRDRFIYLYTDRRPASRFIYQLSGAQFYPGTIPEFINDIKDTPPPPPKNSLKKNIPRHNNFFPHWKPPQKG
ncbi:MAG: hypothetical protein FWD94_03910, partial [Treponema sp.]|nr:hypothetical protein [Treponema sp.]